MICIIRGQNPLLMMITFTMHFILHGSVLNHKKKNIFCYNLTNYFVILGLVDMAEGVIKTSQSVEGKQLSSSTLVRK